MSSEIATLDLPDAAAETKAAKGRTSKKRGSKKAAKKADLFDDERAGSIYRTAARMIYEQGFAATSMNEIAEAVDLTKPGLYYYVKGKKELLFAIMSFAMDQLEENVVAPARRLDDPAERVAFVVREHARLLTHDTSPLAILIDEVAGLSETQRETITRRKRAYFDFIRDDLDALAAAGRLRDVDTTTATFSLLGMVMWIARWYQKGGRMAADVVVDDLAQIALAGVLADPPEHPGNLPV